MSKKRWLVGVFVVGLLLAIVIAFVIPMRVASRVCVPGDAVTVTWQPNTEEDLAGYILWITQDGPDGVCDKAHDGLLIETHFVLLGLAEGNYWLKLEAVDVCGNYSGRTAASDVVTIDLTPPSIPTGLTITAGG